ncbi:MAG: GAF domain-containing protein [Hyphomicrobium sp.]
MTAIVSDRDIDLATCDREPIHIPGSIQAHGIFLACRGDDCRITHASDSAARLGHGAASDILGRTLADVIGKAAAKTLAVSPATTEEQPHVPMRVYDLKIPGHKGLLDATVHGHGGFTIVEFEPVSSGSKHAALPLDIVRGILSKLQLSRKLSDLCDQTVSQLRELIGFDRVMIYRFLQDGAGEVIAESRDADLEPLLHLRYPASDVPRQARELYKKNWLRLIADVHATPSALVSDKALADAPLDLTYAVLRSVSPIHIEYLKNMKVGASMSISILVGGELWGLIACHHATAKAVPSNVRAAAELLGQVFSLQIQTVEGIEAYVTMRAARALLDRVVAEFPVQGELIDNLSQRLDQMASFISCDGIGIWIDGVWRGYGVTPAVTEIAGLAAFIQSQQGQEVVVIQDLAERYPRALTWAADVCGVLATPLSQTRGDYLIFFRKEAAQSISWGGDPNKPAAIENGATRVSPRQSFAAWRETVRGQCLPWTSRERLIGETLRVYLLDIIVRFSDVILEERRQSQQRTRLITSELNHRVKGTLELIRSLVTRGAGESSVKTFVRALEGRIEAITLAHEALAIGKGSDVRSLVEQALAMQAVAADQVQVEGHELKLDPKSYTIVALVIHELVSNALKFGALSVPQGHLSVRWAINPNGALVLSWDEIGGPSVRAPTDRGLGLSIIQRNIPHSLGGEADVEFVRTGLKARFIVPARFLVSAPPPELTDSHKQPLAVPHRPLEGFNLLVLEDQMLLALDLEAMLLERGAATVELAGTVDAALEIIARVRPDAAVLDVDLGDETSLAVAEALEALSIPFVFAAGDMERQFIPQHLRDIGVTPKPYAGDAVAELIRDSLMPHLIRAVLTKLV